MPLYDLVVLGATGFTGRLVVQHLLERYGVEPAEFKWAIAGRSLEKLHSVAASLKAEQLQCLEADNDDPSVTSASGEAVYSDSHNSRSLQAAWF
jgi:short subunit dehydrogenase-like uncharacterized protein